MESQYEYSNPKKKTKSKYNCHCGYYGKFIKLNTKSQCPKCKYTFNVEVK